METATLAGGCFWCTEAIFKRLKGVLEVVAGYAGGQEENPNYEKVSSGTTDHAETIQIKFDPKVISFEVLLEIFFKLHDSTTLNRQGNDVGTQYRSVIFYHNEAQKKEALDKIKKIPGAVTKLEPFSKFYPAEEEHRDFYEKNKSPMYCRIVIDPKIQKLYRDFKQQVKD